MRILLFFLTALAVSWNSAALFSIPLSAQCNAPNAPSITGDNSSLFQIDVGGPSSDYHTDFSTVSIMFAPSNGTVEIDTVNGTFIYTPNAGFENDVEDSFVYRICSASDPTDCTTVDVNVEIGDGTDFFTCEDLFIIEANSQMTFDLDVLANDLNVDPASLNLILFPINGTANQNGSIIEYSPNPGFVGVDEMLYSIQSAVSGESDALKLTVVVGQPNEMVVKRDCQYKLVCEEGDFAKGSVLEVAEPAPAGFSYQWTLYDKDICSATDATFTTNRTGVYSVYLTDGANCVSEEATKVLVVNGDDCTVKPFSACLGVEVIRF